MHTADAGIKPAANLSVEIKLVYVSETTQSLFNIRADLLFLFIA